MHIVPKDMKVRKLKSPEEGKEIFPDHDKFESSAINHRKIS